MRGMVRRTDGVSGVSQEDFLRGRDETRKSDPSVEDCDFIETRWFFLVSVTRPTRRESLVNPVCLLLCHTHAPSLDAMKEASGVPEKGVSVRIRSLLGFGPGARQKTMLSTSR